jgi:hypothetical protein
MAELFAGGRVVDLALGLIAVEALWLAARRTAGLRALLATLLAGALLLLALRAALTGARWEWIALYLGAALGAHAVDLYLRLRPPSH